MNINIAQEIAGNLSNPSKMPCRSYNLPPAKCKVGCELVQVPDSVCHHCYGRDGNYRFPCVQRSMEKHLAAIDHPLWVKAISFLIQTQSPDYFRWHDAGDLQSWTHLEKICQVCDMTPETLHWLPTKEIKLLCSFRDREGLPSNLTPRVSAYLIDGPLPLQYGFPVAGVTRDFNKVSCPSHWNENKCGNCRNCWDPDVRVVWYLFH